MAQIKEFIEENKHLTIGELRAKGAVVKIPNCCFCGQAEAEILLHNKIDHTKSLLFCEDCAGTVSNDLGWEVLNLNNTREAADSTEPIAIQISKCNLMYLLNNTFPTFKGKDKIPEIKREIRHQIGLG